MDLTQDVDWDEARDAVAVAESVVTTATTSATPEDGIDGDPGAGQARTLDE